MKVLFIIDSFGSGGAQRQMVLLAKGMAAINHEIEFFIYHPAHDFYEPELKAHDIKVHKYCKTSQFSFGPVFAIRKVLREGGYDVVLAFMDVPGLYAELASIGWQSPPLVVSERSTYIFHKDRMWKKRLTEQFHYLADVIACNSYNQSTLMAKSNPYLRKKIETILNGVDKNIFYPNTSDSKSDVVIKVLVVGRIDEGKNALGALKALRILREKYNIEILVSWVGKLNGSVSSNIYYDRINELIMDWQLADNWRWLGERSDIADLMRESNVLLHPSFYEGFANVICEAMSCGLPVIASNVCDNGVFVQDAETGFLFDPNDPESIAKAMSNFLSLKQNEVIDMSQKAYKLAVKKFGLDAYVDSYEQLFLRLINK